VKPLKPEKSKTYPERISQSLVCKKSIQAEEDGNVYELSSNPISMPDTKDQELHGKIIVFANQGISWRR